MVNKSTGNKEAIAVIVLNYNGIQDTVHCIDSLLAQTFFNTTVVVVDNASSDDSTIELNKLGVEHPDRIHVIYNEDNLGFAGGVNIGIQWAINEGFEYTALFNNDAIADKDWLNQLAFTSVNNSSLGIVTGLLLNKSGSKIDSSGEQYSRWGLSFPRDRNNDTSASHAEGLTFGATGGASLYRTALFKDIGFFDEDFFAYYEDVDISFRAQLAGWKIAYTPKAIAYHKQGATSKKIPGFAIYQTFKNLPLLFEKNIPKGLLFSVGIRFYFAYTLMFFNAIKNGVGIPATKGLLKSIVLKLSALKKRHDIQKNKRVSSDYIKSILWPDLPPDQTGLRKLRRLFTGKK